MFEKRRKTYERTFCTMSLRKQPGCIAHVLICTFTLPLYRTNTKGKCKHRTRWVLNSMWSLLCSAGVGSAEEGDCVKNDWIFEFHGLFICVIQLPWWAVEKKIESKWQCNDVWWQTHYILIFTSTSTMRYYEWQRQIVHETRLSEGPSSSFSTYIFLGRRIKLRVGCDPSAGRLLCIYS